MILSGSGPPEVGHANEFALLSLLVQRAGQVPSRTQIASLVWGIRFDSDTNVVEVASGALNTGSTA